MVSGATFRLVEGYFEWRTRATSPEGHSDAHAGVSGTAESAIKAALTCQPGGGLPLVVESAKSRSSWRSGRRQDRTRPGRVGEWRAGIGKSRLVKTSRPYDKRVTHAHRMSGSPTIASALYPFIDLLQRVIHWHSDDSPEDRLQRLEVELSQYSRPLLETVPLFASLLSLRLPEQRYPQMGLSAQRQRRKTLEVILALLLERAAQRPVFDRRRPALGRPYTLSFDLCSTSLRAHYHHAFRRPPAAWVAGLLAPDAACLIALPDHCRTHGRRQTLPQKVVTDCGQTMGCHCSLRKPTKAVRTGLLQRRRPLRTCPLSSLLVPPPSCWPGSMSRRQRTAFSGVSGGLVHITGGVPS